MKHILNFFLPILGVMRVLGFSLFSQVLLAQQSPWGTSAQRLGQEFNGPIARGLSLVALVVGGLTVAFSEGNGARIFGSLVFGLGLALGAAQFVTWLFN
jgi:type IV secretion system protein TrbC